MRAPAFWRSGGLLPRLLAPAAATFAAGGRLRWALVRARSAPVPAICVGNLVAGGAGKTPVALALAEAVAGRATGGRPAVHFLTRGHGGRERGPLRVDPARHDAVAVGDEALLLAAAAPTWVARDRRAGAAEAAAAGAELLILDDGFQDPSLPKTLSLLVVDGEYGFGNGRVMPAGPLREPAARGLARADAVVLIGPDAAGVAATLPRRLPLLRARLVPAPGAERLAGQTVYAFAGIGRPEKFFATLAALGCRLAGLRAFADHHVFASKELAAILEAAAAAGAVPVTTAKDHVRLPPEMRPEIEMLEVRLDWDDPAALRELLRPLVIRP